MRQTFLIACCALSLCTPSAPASESNRLQRFLGLLEAIDDAPDCAYVQYFVGPHDDTTPTSAYFYPDTDRTRYDIRILYLSRKNDRTLVMQGRAQDRHLINGNRCNRFTIELSESGNVLNARHMECDVGGLFGMEAISDGYGKNEAFRSQWEHIADIVLEDAAAIKRRCK